MNYIDVKNFRKYEQLFGDNGPAKIGHVNAVIKALNEATSGGGSAYKVYTALLTQNGGDDIQSTDMGLITVGVTYRIANLSPNMDFTNVGAPNNNVGTYFVATGTTPNSWGSNEDTGNSTLEWNNGAPVVTVLENTIGNIWFTFDSDGFYFANSNGLFIENKSWTPTVLIFNDTAGLRDGEICEITRTSSNQYNISTFNQSGTGINGKLNNTPIEIRVYS